MSEQMKERRYLYGVSLDGRPFFVRAGNGKTRHPAALAVLEHIGTAAEAEVKAEELAASVGQKTPSDPEAATELQRGSVAIHRDGAEHFAIVLEVGNAVTKALFFSSKPTWALRWRKASRDEIALAGFATSRSETFLALVERQTTAFEPTGTVFPEHRVEALVAEFLLL